jgi:hypothetical protein
MHGLAFTQRTIHSARNEPKVRRKRVRMRLMRKRSAHAIYQTISYCTCREEQRENEAINSHLLSSSDMVSTDQRESRRERLAEILCLPSLLADHLPCQHQIFVNFDRYCECVKRYYAIQSLRTSYMYQCRHTGRFSAPKQLETTLPIIALWSIESANRPNLHRSVAGTGIFWRSILFWCFQGVFQSSTKERFS